MTHGSGSGFRKHMKNDFSGIKDLDRLILLHLEDDDFLNCKRINKYFYNLYTDIFYRNRIVKKYRILLKCDKNLLYENEKNKERYIEGVYYIKLLKKEYNFNFTYKSLGQPKLYYYTLYGNYYENEDIRQMNEQVNEQMNELEEADRILMDIKKQSKLHFLAQSNYTDLLWFVLYHSSNHKSQLKTIFDLNYFKAALQGCIVADNLPLRRYYAALEHMFQFAHVARPVVRDQFRQRTLALQRASWARPGPSFRKKCFRSAAADPLDSSEKAPACGSGRRPAGSKDRSGSRPFAPAMPAADAVAAMMRTLGHGAWPNVEPCAHFIPPSLNSLRPPAALVREARPSDLVFLRFSCGVLHW